MDNQSIYNIDKLEFRQIVLGHIKRILELSSHELRDTTFIITHGNYSETRHQEDTRFSYIQAIENLAYVLKPYFDDEVKEVYKKCVKIINSFGYEIKIILKKTYDKVCKDVGKESLGEGFYIEMRLKYAKRLFIALNELLHRNDYLKSAVYGEDKDELISDEDEGDSE